MRIVRQVRGKSHPSVRLYNPVYDRRLYTILQHREGGSRDPAYGDGHTKRPFTVLFHLPFHPLFHSMYMALNLEGIIVLHCNLVRLLLHLHLHLLHLTQPPPQSYPSFLSHAPLNTLASPLVSSATYPGVPSPPQAKP